MDYAEGFAGAPHLDNAYWVGDRVSPACDRDLAGRIDRAVPYRDDLFGNVWSWTPPVGAALYGRTADLPPTPVERLGSGSWLRVPFRRVPVVDVRSADELHAIAANVVSADPTVRNAWRGQVRLHALARSEEDGRRLYGEPSAVEPSLLPSASRGGIYFPDVFGCWSGLLDLFIEERLARIVGSTDQRALHAEAADFRCGYRYRQWGFATAQHYGVPSVGLDLTSDLDVALFFALHRFQTNRSTGAMTCERAVEGDDPVVFALGAFDNDVLIDEVLAPEWLHCVRPKAQKAMFFATAWGSAPNRAADRVYMALRLVDHFKWRSPMTPAEVFPSASNDGFLAFLLEAKLRYQDPLVQDVLARVYHVP